ncbi:MAG: SH3 domain-containing protein [Candidatus Chryseobacterium colombiense]|nr:SH3 domain-containing protein [Chryseobacterium sp.]WEK68741.1 MAG: SH3 domain-containing protein [Chryseobacterium sp.]
MKRLIPFIILTFTLFLLNSCFKANDNVGHDGRCTGSAYCTACSNCSGCGHCSGGGTCGVCGGGSGSNSSSGSSTKKSKSKKHRSSDSYKKSRAKSNKPPKVFIDEVNINVNSNRYIAATSMTNIYEKPSFKSKVIEKVAKSTKLIQLSKKDSWYKIQVKKSGKVGYIFNKDVK